MATKTRNSFRSWEYPKRSGILIRELLNRHLGESFGASYVVAVPSKITGGERQRKQFKALSKAEQWAKTAFRGARKEGEAYFAMSAAERHEIAACLPDLRKHGVSISDAIRFAIKGMRPGGCTKTLPDVVAELVASKKQRMERGDLRERSYLDFAQRADRVSDGFKGRLISEVTIEQLKTWIEDLECGPRSNQNYLAAIGEVFKFATQKRYIAVSPLDHLTDVERKELCGRGGETKEPSILTPTQAEKLLKAALAHPDLDLLGAVTLALFSGLRTEEIKRLSWDQVRLADTPPEVTVGAKIAKKRRIRHVEIAPAALPWLALVPDRTGLVAPLGGSGHYQLRFARLLKFAEFKTWEANAMRHSFGSYHFALHGDSMKTSRLLGHRSNDEVLFSHYRALASKETAEKYFAISPPASVGKVVRFA